MVYLKSKLARLFEACLNFEMEGVSANRTRSTDLMAWLTSTKFQACPERKKLVFGFNNWKGQSSEAVFCPQYEREEREELGHVRLQVDHFEDCSARCFAR